MQQERYFFLDGLRGWAAVTVMLFHYYVEALPYNGSVASALGRLLPFDGVAAVHAFFVISGFSLSAGHVRRRDGVALARLAISRYPRLAIPVFAACAIVFAMMSTGLHKAFLPFQPNVAHLIRSSLYDAFFDYQPRTTFIPPLWTMQVELLGSAVVVLLLAAFGQLRRRLWIHGGLFVCFGSIAATHPVVSMCGLFVAGMMLAEWHASGAYGFPGHKVVMALFFAQGWLASCLSHTQSTLYYVSISAFCAAVFYLEPLQRFFGNAVGRFLGRISFPLYLLHAAVLHSFARFAADRLAALGFDPSVCNVTAATASVAVAISAAVLFAPVNEWAIRVSHGFARAMIAGWRMVFEWRRDVIETAPHLRRP